MFHFLVKYDGWPADRASMDKGRVFEYTDETITAQLQPAGNFQMDRILAIPALFVSETGGSGDQRARIGRINRVELANREIVLEYSFDSSIPPIPNSTIEKLSAHLSVGDWELTRTHWAVKDVDLFKVLLLNQGVTSPTPKVFRLDEAIDVNDQIVSVMMPFSNRFDPVYATIQETATSVGLECFRADDIWENDAIIQDVVSLIKRSRIVVCDCTGRNANVFYEVGIAHTLGRDVILISQSHEDIPFDLRHLRYIDYLNNGEGRAKLSGRLKKRLTTLTGKAGRK
jgi:hypothetical protein